MAKGERKLKVALVGCGQIADAHLQEIRKLAFAEPVALCDRHLDLARQAAERFEVPVVFDDLERMLEEVEPEVLHITTPPHTHATIARQALAAGSHVYVEKPFALDAAEADEILDAAREHGRLVCVGHDQLFDPIWRDCRRRHARGEFGQVVHVESLMGYDLGGPFGQVLSAEPDHWVHRLPGGLFQNTIPHALYKITEFLCDDAPEVWATWFDGPGGAGFPTELRVFLKGAEVTASLTFSSVVRPVQRVVRLYGTRAGAEVDFDSQVLRPFHAAALPGALAKVEQPMRQVWDAGRSAWQNFLRFARGDLHYFEGMRRLFAAFYRAVAGRGEPPIAYEEIRRVTALMDAIFTACRSDREEWSSVRDPEGAKVEDADDSSPDSQRVRGCV